MAMQTNTQVAAVSKIKMATALLFLGAAALAASAAGGLASRRGVSVEPDLIVRKIAFEKGAPQGKGSHQDTLKVYYMNTGSGAVNQPFYIMIRLDPAPYTEGGTSVQYISPTGPAASGFSGAIPDFIFKDADVESPNHYVIPVENLGGDSSSLPNINKYNLAPGEWGHVDVYLPKYYQDMLEKGMLSIDAFVDYTPADNNGKIPESNEKNNQGNILVKASSVTLLEKNFCEMDYNPMYIYPPCVEAGQQYACVDKYTGQFKGCSPDVKACAEYVGEVLACDVNANQVIETGTLSLTQDLSNKINFPILAGTEALIGRIKLEATDEDILLEDLAIHASSSVIYSTSTISAFKTLSLYSNSSLSQESKIDGEGYVDGEMVFENLNYIVEKDTVTYLYVTVDLLSYQQGAHMWQGFNFAISEEGTKASGSDSQNELSADNLNVDTSYTPPGRVVAAVQPIVNSTFAGGTLVGGEQIIHSFSVENPPNPNQNVDTILTNARMKISSNVESISDVKLCHVGNGECYSYTLSQKYTSWNGESWWNAYGNITSNVGKLYEGGTTEYVLFAVVGGVPNDGYLQTSIISADSYGVRFDVEDANTNKYLHIFVGSKSTGLADWPSIVGGTLIN